MVKRKKPIKAILHEHITGIIIGAIVSGAVSFVLWSFAYFGFIDLGLPDRFNYEKMNHLVGTYLPEDFNKKEITITNFRQGGDQTLVYIGQRKEFYYPDKDTDSDTILFFDKTDKKYQLSYRFTPQRTSKETNYPLHVHSAGVTDLNSDGRNDLIVAFSEMGAHWSPPLLVVFYSDGDKVLVAGVPQNLSRYHSSTMVVNNHDTAQKVTDERADMLLAGGGLLAYVVRTDDECYGCSEDHIFTVNYLHLFDGKLVKTQSDDTGIKGYDALRSRLDARGITALEYSTF